VSSPIGFESPYPVAVSQVGPSEWALTAPLVYHGTHQVFTVAVGETTDFASVPAVLTWLVPIETGVPAAVLHDHLWRHEVVAGRITFPDADGLLRQALGTLGVPVTRRWVMWAAVRWGALTRHHGWDGWWRDAPAVLAVTLLALPLVLPAVVLLPSLLVFAALDAVTAPRRRGPAVSVRPGG
jgi:uncharacterized protein DUF1353